MNWYTGINCGFAFCQALLASDATAWAFVGGSNESVVPFFFRTFVMTRA